MLDLGVRYSPETFCQCSVSLSKTLHPLLNTGSTQKAQAPSLPCHKSSLPYPLAFVVAKILIFFSDSNVLPTMCLYMF